MAEPVVLVMKGENSDLIKKTKEAQKENQKLYDNSVEGQKKQKKAIDETNKSIKDLFEANKKGFGNVKLLEDYTKKMDALKKKVEELSPPNRPGPIDNVEKQGTKLTTSMIKWGSVLAGITAALVFMKEAFISTGVNAAKFTTTIAGLKSGFDAIKVAISTLDFKDFNKKVRDAINEGRRYAEALNDMEGKMRALKIAEANAANALLQQRQIQQSALSTQIQKIEAGKEAIKIEENLAKIRMGIAEQAYKNELDNVTRIAFQTEEINDTMRSQIELYLNRDAAFLEGIKLGNKYNTMLSEKRDIELSGNEITANQLVQLKLLNNAIATATDEQKKWGDIAKAVSIPLDEKYNLLTERSVDLIEAKGYALEKTLRIQTRLSSDQVKATKEETDALQKDLELRELMEKYTNEYFADEQKRMQEDLKLKELMEKYTDEYFIKDAKRKQKDLSEKERMERYTQEYFDNEKQRNNEELKVKREHTEAKINLAKSASNILFMIAGKNKGLQKAALISDQAIAIAEVIIQTQKQNAATKAWGALAGPAGMALAAAAVIKNQIAMAINIAAIVAATAAGIAGIGKYAKGGWTGNGKDRDSTGERVAGIVHEREFVVRKGPAHKFRDVLEAINRDDKRMIFNSFNKLNPEMVGGTTVNNVVVQNEGPNKRLDQVIIEQRKLNKRLSLESVQEFGTMTVIKRGQSVRTIRK
jgi:hypothetical protein